jgi:hypothetical protein
MFSVGRPARQCGWSSGWLAVVRVDLDDGGGRIVHVVTADPAAVVCPSCGASSTRR